MLRLNVNLSNFNQRLIEWILESLSSQQQTRVFIKIVDRLRRERLLKILVRTWFISIWLHGAPANWIYWNANAYHWAKETINVWLSEFLPSESTCTNMTWIYWCKRESLLHEFDLFERSWCRLNNLLTRVTNYYINETVDGFILVEYFYLFIRKWYRWERQFLLCKRISVDTWIWILIWILIM